jgi:hypothetical protein
MEHTTWKCEPRKSLALVRGLTMRLLARVLLALVLVVLVSALLVGCQQTRSTGGVTRSSAVPDFVQVGKSYDFLTGGRPRGEGFSKSDPTGGYGSSTRMVRLGGST